MNLKLINLYRLVKNDEGVWGVFVYNYRPFAVSGELPWHDNKDNLSCIPEGCYTAELFNHPNKGRVFKLMDVNSRDGILIHIGNIPKRDSLGCILIGEGFEMFDDMQGIVSSKNALNELLKIVGPDKQILLKIEDKS